MSGRSSVIKFLNSKILEITSTVVFIFTGKRKKVLQNSYSKQLFGKLQGKLSSVLKKDSIKDV